MKDEILNLIEKTDFVSFVELGRIKGLVGELAISLNEKYPNIVLWSGLSQEGLDSIQSLLKEKKIRFVEASVLTYFADGGALNLPIAKRLTNYKKPHWLPVCFRSYGKK